MFDRVKSQPMREDFMSPLIDQDRAQPYRKRANKRLFPFLYPRPPPTLWYRRYV